MAIDDKESRYIGLTKKLDTKFLKGENYQSLGKSFEYLVEDFINVIVTEVLPERKKIVETGDVKKLQEIAEQVYAAKWTFRLSGGTTDVVLVPLAMSFPIDYIGFYKRAAEAKWKQAQDALGRGDRSKFEKGIQDGYFNTQGDFLDRRKKPYEPFKKDAAYLASVLAFAKSKDGKWKSVFQDTLGGETDDRIVRLLCCGKDSITKVCPMCKKPKPVFQLEIISRSVMMKFDGVVKVAEKEKMVNGVAEKYIDINWVRDEGSIPRNRTRITEEELDEIRSDPLFMERTLKKSQLEQDYVTHMKSDGKPDRSRWIVFQGMVATINATKQSFGIGKGMFNITVSTKEESFTGGKNAGVKVHIPDHVWEFMGGNRINQYSSVIVIGHMERQLAYDRVARKTIDGQWNPPEIVAWNVFITDGGKPESIEADVTEGDYEIEDPLSIEESMIPETKVSSVVSLPPVQAASQIAKPTTSPVKTEMDSGSQTPSSVKKPVPSEPARAINPNDMIQQPKKEDDGWL